MSRTAGRGRGDDGEAGVSTVLGAILMFGLLVVTLVMIQTQFVPVWDKQREEDTMLDVSKQVNTLKSDLDRLAGNQSATPISNHVSLAKPQGFTFFQGSSNQLGTLSFAPPVAGSGMTVSSNQLTVQNQNGRQFFGIAEEWEGVGPGVTIPAIDSIVHMRLRLVDPSCEGYAGHSCPDPSTMTIVMTDRNGMCAGKIVLIDTEQSGSDNNIEAKIYRANNPIATTCDDSLDTLRPNPITLMNWNQKKQLNPPFFYVDAFDPTLHFDSVLAAAAYPLSVVMTLAPGGVQGDYTIVYDTTSGGGSTRVGGGGLVIPNYSATFPLGTLSVQQPNSRAPTQNYYMEYGAVFLEQPGQGAAMVVPPLFTASTTTTQTSVQWSFPALSGNANQVTAAGGGIVLASPTGQHTTYEASAPSLVFAITTSYPALWASYWQGTMELAGMTGDVEAVDVPCSTGGVQYSICSTATTATLTLYGPVTAGASTADDLFFRFNEGGVAIQLRPAG